MVTVNIGLLVRLTARPGKAEELSGFLTDAASLAEREAGTTTWFAFRLNDNDFGIFDTFADEYGRDAHRGGEIATLLRQRASDLLSRPPTIEPCQILGCKL